MNAGHWITSLVKRILNLPAETDQRPTHQPTLHVTRLEPRFVLNGSPVPLDPQGMNQQVHDVGPALGTANLMVVQAPDTPQLVNANGQAATGGSELRLVREGSQASVLVDGLQSGEVKTDGGLLVRGGPGAETLVIDFSLGNPIPVGGLVFEGGAGFDQVQIVGGSFDHVAATLSENGSGRLEIDGRVIEFRGVESVIDHLNSTNRTVALSGTDDAHLTAGTPGVGQELRLAFSDSTEFRFNAASDSLSINLGSESSSATTTRISDAAFQSSHVSIVGGSDDRIEFSGQVAFAADTVHVSAGEIDIAGSIVANTSASHDVSIAGRAVSVDLNAVRSLNFHTDSNVTLAGGRLLADAGRGGTLILEGNLDASAGDSGGLGGSITLLGARVGLGSTARIDVSGPVAGQVLIGGAGPEARGSLPASERLSVVSGATIHADGMDSGSGGRVILWSETATRYQGFISVQAGARGGDGGLVEVSSGGQLLFRGDVNLAASHGTQGTLLLDPLTITIVNQNGGANDSQITSDKTINFDDAPPDAFTISETALESLSGTIVLQARDKIVLANLTTDGVLTLKDQVNLVLQTSNDTGNAVTQPGITFDNVANTIRPVTNGSISITMMAGVTIDSSGKVLTNTGTGLISVGNLLTGGGDLLLGASQNVLLKGNVDSGTGTIRATANNGIIQVAAGLTFQSANTASDAIILKSNSPEIGTNSKVQATGTGGGIVVRSANNNTMSIGGSSEFVLIPDNLLARFQTTPTGSITFGDDEQTADIRIQTASFSNVGTIRVVQSTTESGRIILDDEGTGIALNGGSSAISLTAGTGGIVAATSSNTFAEIATTGPTVTLNTAGGIGEKSATVNRPIQLADNSSTSQQVVVIGSTNSPTSPVYLEGLGALTLGSVTLPTTDLYVTTKGAVAEATGAAINTSLLSVTTRNDSGAAITLNGPGNTATNVDFSALKSTTTDAANAEIAYTGDAGFEIVNVKTAGTATFTARGAVTQSGGIVAGTLRVTTRNDSGAAITLDKTGNDSTNVDFSTLNLANTDAATADITYTGDAGFNIVNVKSAGTTTLTAHGAVTQSGGIVADTLRVTTRSDTGAAITLDKTGNNATNVEFSTLKLANTDAVAADIAYTGDAGFEIVNVKTAGAAALTASGAVTQSGGIVANTLSVTTRNANGAAITLDGPGNTATKVDLSVLKSATTDAANADIAYTGDAGFEIVNVKTAGATTLTASGAVTQSGGIVANRLSVTTRNDNGAEIKLNGPGNTATQVDFSVSRSATANVANADIAYTGDAGFAIVNVKTAGAATLTASGAVTQSGGIVANTLSVTTRNDNGAAITLNGPGNTATQVDFSVLKSATSNVANADIAYTGDAGFEIVNVKTAGTATLTAQGAVTQSGGIVANTLGVTTRNANGAAITLNGPGNTAAKVNFSILKSATTDAANADIAYTGDAGFEIVNVKTAGTAALTAHSAVTQSGGIVAETLRVTTRNANGAAITLDGPGNNATKVDFSTLKSATTDAANANVSYTGDAGFEIVQVKTAGTATLTAHGSVTEENGSSIVADKLLLLGSGSFELISTANDVASLAADFSGSVTYQDANSFTVDRVGTVDGIGASATGVQLRAQTDLIIAKTTASNSGVVALFADSDSDGTGTLTLNDGISVSSGLTVPSGSSEAVILSGAVFDFGTNSAAQATGVGGGVAIRSSDSTRTINLGAGGGAGDLVVDVPIFSHISTLTSGFIAVGDSTQSGDIRISGPSFGTTGEIRVLQSSSKNGQIILDDANTVTALDGGNRNIVLAAGTKGVASVHGTNNLAEIATTGAKVTINTRGGIGSLSNPLQFADNAIFTQQNVTIGTGVQPTSNVYLGGLGALTLGSIRLSSADLDVSASGVVAESAGASIFAKTLSVTTRNDIGANINLANSGNRVTTLALGALKSSTSGAAKAQVSYSSSTGVTISSLNTAGTAMLVLGGAVNQSGGISAETLQVTTRNDNGAAITLNGPGNVVSKVDLSVLKSTTSDAATADIAYTGDAGFEIVNVKTAGTATLTAHAEVTQSGGIVAGTLSVTTRKDTGATIALDGPGNVATNVDFSTLMSTTSDTANANIAYTGDAGFNIVNVKTAGTATFTAHDAVTQSGGIAAGALRVTTRNDGGAAITLNGPGNTATKVDFSTLKSATTDSATADIAYTGDAGFEIVNVKSAGTATLTAHGAVTQSGGIAANTLKITTKNDTGSSIKLTQAGNEVQTLDLSALNSTGTNARIADLVFNDATGFDVANIRTAGTATLTAGGAVTQSSGNIRANAFKVITANDPGAAITLTRSSNDVQSLDLRTLSHDGSQTQNANVSYRDLSGFVIANLSSAGTVSLTAGGEVTQSSAIQVQNLLLSGTGPWILDRDNDVGVIAGANLGSVTLRDINNLTVDTVAGVSGLSATTNGAVVSLNVAQTLTVSKPLRSTAGDVQLTANKLDLQSDVVAQTRITILPQDPNLPIDLGTATPGKFGITLAGLARFSAQVLQVGNSGTASITVTQAVDLVNVTTLQLESSAGISETSAGEIAVANLVINAGSAATFGAANDVGSLAANVGGDLVYRDRSGFTVASTGINANGHNVSLTAAQGVSQSGIIQGGQLSLTGAGPWTLNTQLNNVAGLTADVQGNLLYQDADGFVVNRILALNHDISLTASQGVSQSGAIQGGSLSLNGAGPWNLSAPQNNVASLSANVQGDLFYRDADGFVVTGINAVNQSVSLLAAQDVSQTAAINARVLSLSGGGAWTLNTQNNDITRLVATVNGPLAFRDDNGFVVGGITALGRAVTLTSQSQVTEDGAILADSLSLTGAGPWRLNSQQNNVASLSADIQGDLLYRDVDGFVVAGINAHNHDVSLTAEQEVTESAAIRARNLSLTGAGPWTLNTQLNNVATLSADVQGNLRYLDADGFVVAGINAHNHDIALTAAQAVSQTGAILGRDLTLSGQGPWTLDTQNNDVARLFATVDGALAFRDDNGFIVGGITATGRAVTLVAQDRVTEEGAIVADSLSLNGAGPWTLNTHQNNVARLTAQVAGDLLYRDADGFVVAGIDAQGHDVSLAATGPVSQTVAIKAGRLTLDGADSWKLDDASNDVTRLAATVGGDLAFRDVNGFTVGGIDATGKQVTLTAAQEVTQEGAIVADSLSLNGAGPWTLNTQQNNVTSLTAQVTGNLFYQDADGFVVNGITAQGVDVSFTATQAVTQTSAIVARQLTLTGTAPWTLDTSDNDVGRLAATVGGDLAFRDVNGFIVAGIDATGKQVTLSAAQEVTQEGAIVADSLSLNGAGPWTLNTQQNNVASLTAQVTGNLLYQDADGFVVNGITAQGVDVSFTATQAVTQTSAIVARQLALTGTGPWSLDTSDNDVGRLAATVGGDLAFRDTNGFVVAGIDATGKQVTLTAAQEVTQERAIIADSLSLNGAGPWALNTQQNNVARLSADIQGNLLYRDADGFDVAGIQTQSFDVTLVAPQEVTQSGAIKGGMLSLNGAGPWTLKNPDNLVASLIADIHGDLFFQNADRLVLNRLTAPGHTATLVAGGTVSQISAITVDELNVTVMNDSAPPLTSDITLINPDNDAGAVSLQIVRTDHSRGNGTVAYVGQSGVKIARIFTAGSALFSSGSNRSPNGLVVQTGAIDADSLKVTGTGNFQLTMENSVGTFAADVTGSLNFNNRGDLQIGTVNGTPGIKATRVVTPPTGKAAEIVRSTGDIELKVDGNLTVLNNITAGGKLQIEASGSTNLESKLPNQSGVTGVELTAGNPASVANPPVKLLGLRPYLTATPIKVSQDIDVSPDGTASVSLVVGRESEKGLNVEISWGDGIVVTYSQEPGKDGIFVAGTSFTITHTYSLESILDQLGGAKPGSLGGSNLFEVYVRAFVAPVGDVLPLSFKAQTVSPTGAFATEVPPNQAGQVTQVFLVTPDADGNFQLTANELVVFVANPGIGLAGTELSQFGSREFILPVRPETPQTQQPPTTVLVNAAANATDETSPSGATAGRDEVFKIRRILDEDALREKRSGQSVDPRNPEIRPEWLGLEEGQLNDLDVIRKSFLRLPDGRYQITQQRGQEGTERVILDIQLKQGKPTPVEDLEKPRLELDSNSSPVDSSSDSRTEGEPEEVPDPDAADLETRIPAPLSVAPGWGSGNRIDPRAEVALALLRVRLSEQRPTAAPSSPEHPSLVSTAESTSLRRTNDFPLVDPRESP